MSFTLCGWPVMGFRWTLNGWTVSALFGALTYCDNHGEDSAAEWDSLSPVPYLDRPQSNAELAVFRHGGDFVRFPDQPFLRSVPFDVIAKLLGYLADGPQTADGIRRFLDKLMDE